MKRPRKVKGPWLPICPVCKKRIAATRLDTPLGIPSCTRCGARLRRSQHFPRELEIVAQADPDNFSSRDNLRVEDFDQSAREYRLVDALQENPWRVLKVADHRNTIRKTESWMSVLTEVTDLLPLKAKAQRIAEVLCAAKLWAERTVAIRKERDAKGAKEVSFDALQLRRWYIRERQYHGRFKRKSRGILTELREFKVFLTECETYSTGYKGCIDACEKLFAAIAARVNREPSLHGTRLQHPSKTQPSTWASALVFRIHRRKRMKKEVALAETVALLAIVFPEYRTTHTEPLRAKVWQAHLRTLRWVRGL